MFPRSPSNIGLSKRSMIYRPFATASKPASPPPPPPAPVCSKPPLRGPRPTLDAGMTLHHAIWTVAKPAPLAAAQLASEQLLEDMIVAAPQMLSNSWMLIGRQERTLHAGRIDLLAIAPDDLFVVPCSDPLALSPVEQAAPHPTLLARVDALAAQEKVLEVAKTWGATLQTGLRAVRSIRPAPWP